jgi:hypothetical protein
VGASWSTPPFASLPIAAGEARWVGSQIMERDQYVGEGWERMTKQVGEKDALGTWTMVHVDYWRLRLSSAIAWNGRRRQTIAERHEVWKQRQEEQQATWDDLIE